MNIENKEKFGRRNMLIASIITILCIFFMFGWALHWNTGAYESTKNNPTMFELAFGLNTFSIYRRPGFTAIFVIELLAIIASIFSILCYFNILLNQDVAPIFAVISSIFSFVLFILAFCSRKLCGVHWGGLIIDEAYLGFGSILFAVSHIIAILFNASGIILTNR